MRYNFKAGFTVLSFEIQEASRESKAYVMEAVVISLRFTRTALRATTGSGR